MNMNMKIVGIFVVGLLVGASLGYIASLQMSGAAERARIAELEGKIRALQTKELTGKIVVKGSDTLLIVAQRWAEEFMKLNPGVSISVAGGGSGVGFAALAQKTADIADASREIKASERDTAKANGVDPVEWTVGLDGIAIVVNRIHDFGDSADVTYEP